MSDHKINETPQEIHDALLELGFRKPNNQETYYLKIYAPRKWWWGKREVGYIATIPYHGCISRSLEDGYISRFYQLNDIELEELINTILFCINQLEDKYIFKL